jgi:signal transduction histidine kinase
VEEIHTAEPCCPGELRALAALADVARVFARSDMLPEIGEGVVRVLVSRRVAWCVLFVDDGQGGESVLAAARRPDVDRVELEPRAAAAAAAPTGIGARLPADGDSWGEDGCLAFTVSDAGFELRADSWGVVEIATPDRRYGSLVIGTGPDQPPLAVADRRLLGRIAEKTAAAFEHAELNRSILRCAQARDTIVGVVVHDLATPLNSVDLLLSRIAAAEPDERGPVHRYVETAHRSLERVRRLVNDLVDVRDIERGLFSPALSSQPIGAILCTAVEQVEPLALDRGVALHLPEPAVDEQVMADPARIVQLLVNLLTNAVQASSPGGTVRIGLSRTDRRWAIDVEDRGTGIDPERIPHLFDGLSGPAPSDGRRRGLGLFIAAEIARAHGAPLQVKSTPGAGSTFRFSLPAGPADPAAYPAAPPGTMGKSSSR